ncbi:MAG: hypothetical protein JHC31_00320 [Sulfurihydrogenibium sp.]|nr:hypothetical protein [Sulfurihydrogenibium sp.]
MAVQLNELPITKITGEFAKLNESKHIIFPQILKSFNTTQTLNSFTFYDGFYLNNKIIYIYSQDKDKVLYNLNTVYEVPIYNGFCVFGSVYFVFYQNKCLVIDTRDDSHKTVNLTIDNSNQGIVKVKQLTPQMFAIITNNPTTIHLFGLDSAGAIASAKDGDTVNINSFTYATFSNPTFNIDLIYYDEKIYLIGDDYTVILDLEMKDLVYLITKETYNYRKTPFKELEDAGIKFIRETQSFYIFYNTVYNSYIYITKDFKDFYFGRETVYLTPEICFKIQGSSFYQITDLLQSEFAPITTYHEINFRLTLSYTVFQSLIINIPETQKGDNDRIATLNIEARYDAGYNIFSYGILYNRSNYRLLSRGEEFVISLYSNNAMRIENVVLIPAGDKNERKDYSRKTK